MSSFYNSILVPVDFTKRSELQILQAYYIGKIFNKPVTILHVLNRNPSLLKFNKPEDQENDLEQHVKEKLSRITSAYRSKYKHEFLYILKEGIVHEVILDLIKKESISVVVMGKSGKSSIFQHSIGKSTAEIIHQSQCPVMTINQIIKQTFRKILLPLDLNLPVQNKLIAAMVFSRQYGAPLKIIHVVTAQTRHLVPMYEEKLYQIKKYLTDFNVASSYELIFDLNFSTHIPQKIVEYAELNECDLIMIMTRKEIEKNIISSGSTATNVIRYSKIPVLSITPSFNIIYII